MFSYPTVFVITGPSGVGKSTILEQVFQVLEPHITFAVSSTTRDPRPGEEDGVDYNFVSKDQFQELIKADALLEWAEVFGNYYGTPWKALDEPLNQGKSVILDLDIQGHRNIRKSSCKAVHIFVAPPGNSLDVLRERLEKRGETAENIAKRMSEAQQIMDAAHEYDYVIVNDDLNTAVFAMLGFLMCEMDGLL